MRRAQQLIYTGTTLIFDINGVHWPEEFNSPRCSVPPDISKEITNMLVKKTIYVET